MRPGNVELRVEGVLYEMRPSTKTAILDILKPCTIIVQDDQGDRPERVKSEKQPDYHKAIGEEPPEEEKPKPPKAEKKKGGMFRRDVS